MDVGVGFTVPDCQHVIYAIAWMCDFEGVHKCLLLFGVFGKTYKLRDLQNTWKLKPDCAGKLGCATLGGSFH